MEKNNAKWESVKIEKNIEEKAAHFSYNITDCELGGLQRERRRKRLCLAQRVLVLQRRCRGGTVNTKEEEGKEGH